ncbi:hypothetical protein [Methylomonas koyamae]|uniref:hypothetical protein n=1 Tax=Methylomonas koyamae TaxID=702114 RepID=UPI0028733D0F|nr:hypothetical protein [Methylomonas koyamae]WNB74604.1 hypothetical protein RI210_15080 [Methylomonas koyamae]
MKLGAVVPINNKGLSFYLISMTQPIASKPEPRKARTDWCYQTYFLSQRQRRETVTETTSAIALPIGSKSHPSPTLQAERRDQVIAQMEALAASIGVRLTIVNQDTPHINAISLTPGSLVN